MLSNQTLATTSVNVAGLSSDFSMLLVGTAPNYTGYGTGASDSGQVGIDLTNKNNYHIHDVQFANINGTAVNVVGGAANGGWQHFGHLSDIGVMHSYYGFKFTNAAEYETVSDCQASNCVFGFLVDSGNNTFSNCKATYCSIGVKISGGTNNGHGVWNGLQSNHCTYNLTCQNVSYGEHFIGSCFIADQGGSDNGNIQIINSQGITFSGGQIAYMNISIDATSQVQMDGVTLRGPVAITVASGGIFSAKNNLVMPGATITLNGAAFSGNN